MSAPAFTVIIVQSTSYTAPSISFLDTHLSVSDDPIDIGGYAHRESIGEHLVAGKDIFVQQHD